MYVNCKILTFLRQFFRSIRRKFTRRPRPIELDEFEYHENQSPFTCDVCWIDVQPGDGVILKDCIHRICKACIIDVIKYSVEAEIRCPYINCRGVITDREIRCFISYEDYEKLLDRSLNKAEMSNKNAFHCNTVNCIGWVEINSRRIERFRCEICDKVNCVPCKAVHETFTCAQFREQRKMENQLSNRLIEQLLKERKLRRCPRCTVLIEKNMGCDQMRCAMCKQDFYWSIQDNVQIRMERLS
ncbi:ranBP-type and C3HC4-type zinc finger-containing protein 1-like [Chironomus tepperi]|uniref:ranBP-type and C3HC4-type zinc finger-containing protein 1-like n=1 Tax=Chironomus tepperi TaxID=113505 RepID=UPI00391F8DAE